MTTGIKADVDEAIRSGLKELFLSPNLMREAISWLAPTKPQSRKLQLFSKDKKLLLIIQTFDEVTNWEQYSDLIETGRESDALYYEWEISCIQNNDEPFPTKKRELLEYRAYYT